MKTTASLFAAATTAALFLSACAPNAGGGGARALSDCTGARDNSAILGNCTKVIDRQDAPARERAMAHAIRAGALQATGKAKEAIADSDAAVKLAPQDAGILANRGAIYSMQGNMQAAIRDLDAAVAMGPESAFMLGNRAIIHDKMGEWAEGHAKIRRALKLDPQSVPLWGELCWNGAAGSPDPAGAIPDCDKAIALSDVPNNYNSRGMAHYRAGKYAEAIADYDKSIAGDPGVGSSFYMRGLAKQALGQGDAQADIDHGLALEPGVRERYVNVGVLPP